MIKRILKGVITGITVAGLTAGCSSFSSDPKHKSMYLEDPYGVIYPYDTDYSSGLEDKEQFKEEQVNNFLKALDSKEKVLHIDKCSESRNKRLCKAEGNYSKDHTVYTLENGSDWLGRPEQIYSIVVDENGKVKSFKSNSNVDWAYPVISINKPLTGSTSASQLKKIGKRLETITQD
jgi:hypothetical protein